jgi:hypothetical protein
MQVRPKGCFHMKCVPSDQAAHGSAERDCFFYNTAPMDQDLTDPDFAGSPVCERHLFESGVEGEQSGCPPEYKVIDDDNLCETMCHVDDYACNGNFREGLFNYTQHHDFPQGCFTMTEDSQGALPHVYWNEISGAGTDLRGTPLCVVETPLSYNSGNGMPGMFSSKFKKSLHNTTRVSQLGEDTAATSESESESAASGGGEGGN